VSVVPNPAASLSATAERILPEEVSLPDDARPPFRFTPGVEWSPLVISFPHVGLMWPHELGPKPQADFAANADHQVQRLYPGAAKLGVACLEAVYSRLVVDSCRL
jgi:N-formylglutamate deformylase